MQRNKQYGPSRGGGRGRGKPAKRPWNNADPMESAQGGTSNAKRNAPLPSKFPVSSGQQHMAGLPIAVSRRPQESNVGGLVSERQKVLDRLRDDPGDLDAIRQLHQVVEKAKNQNLLHVLREEDRVSLPGQFTGSTGVQCLSQEQLRPANRRFEPWATKDRLRQGPKVTGGIGMKLLQQMGWQEGQGLGKFESGSIEPLAVDVKSDRKGLLADDEQARRKKNARPISEVTQLSLAYKHPVVALNELCSKRHWGWPTYHCVSISGDDHQRSFTFKCTVNGVDYQPTSGAASKKDARVSSAQVALEALGIVTKAEAIPTSSKTDITPQRKCKKSSFFRSGNEAVDSDELNWEESAETMAYFGQNESDDAESLIPEAEYFLEDYLPP